MTDHPDTSRRRNFHRPSRALACPACGSSIRADAKWCPNCNFSGAQTLELFQGPPPPLLPILDAVGLFTPPALKRIEAARHKLSRRYPQFDWRFCTVQLPPDTSVSLFAFWLLNACPIFKDETDEKRAWTVLLLLDVHSGQASVATGYLAEPWLSDEDWRRILTPMAPLWRAGQTVEAVTTFFKTASQFLDESWKRHGLRHPRQSPP